MESQKQAIRVRSAINKVILTLIGKEYKIPDGGQTLAVVEQGIKKINQKLYPYSDMADDRIIDYLVYHLYLKREPRRRFTINEFFSDYAIAKYRQQFIDEGGKSGMNYYINQWLEDGDFTRAGLTKLIEKPKPHKMSKFIYMESEELIKKRFINTDMGYMLCQRSTTGWSPRSQCCQICKNASQCIHATEQKYPELIRLRRMDYENGKKDR